MKPKPQEVPFCRESEIQTLGSLLQDPSMLSEIAGMGENHFYLQSHRCIFGAILSLAANGDPVDTVTVADYLKAKGTLSDCGGVVYLCELVDATPTASNIGYHAKKVMDAAQRRELLSTCHELATKTTGAGNINTILAEAVERLSAIPCNGAAPAFLSANELIAKTFDEKRAIIEDGVLPHGGSLVIAGESGVGKSLIRTELAIRLTMGWSWLDFEVPTARRVLIVSFETPLTSEQYRIKRMLSGFQISKLPGHLSFADPGIRVDLKLKGDRRKLLEIIKRGKAEVIIYDPLSSLHSVNENDNSEMRSVLDTLTEINRKCETSCILVHHYGKPSPDKANEHRTRGASSIRDWCDTLIGLTKKAHEDKTLRLIEFHKVRNGAQPKPILLERDEYFLHKPVDEDTLCPPSMVAEILEGMGGRVDSQKQLLDEIMTQANCAIRSAKTYVKLAVERGSIVENERDGKCKSYTLQNNKCKTNHVAPILALHQ